MTPLSEGIDVPSLIAGFAFGGASMIVSWIALLGISMLRKMLSDASEL